MPNFNLTNQRPMTMRKPKNSTIYFPINQVSNISTNNFNVMLSSMPNITEKPKRNSSSIRRDSESKNLINDSKKKDAVTQTEEIFFKMYYKA